MTYNGWKNHATWNVALWLQNDEGLYRFARHFTSYRHLAEALADATIEATTDGVRYDSPDLDIEALNEMLEEL